MKLKFLKYYISNMLLNLFNNYNALIDLLFLFFSINMNQLKEYFVLYSSYIINKINSYDNLLFN